MLNTHMRIYTTSATTTTTTERCNDYGKGKKKTKKKN